MTPELVIIEILLSGYLLMFAFGRPQAKRKREDTES